ncbi:uncharacterized protein [Procambarus clarkii]|uniref:uncharacterized protein isoform X1 n=2 Tax=Procambarus clarkii TaxID=6728 RepID=UPI0037428959
MVTRIFPNFTGMVKRLVSTVMYKGYCSNEYNRQQSYAELCIMVTRIFPNFTKTLEAWLKRLWKVPATYERAVKRNLILSDAQIWIEKSGTSSCNWSGLPAYITESEYGLKSLELRLAIGVGYLHILQYQVPMQIRMVSTVTLLL